MQTHREFDMISGVHSSSAVRVRAASVASGVVGGAPAVVGAGDPGPVVTTGPDVAAAPEPNVLSSLALSSATVTPPPTSRASTAAAARRTGSRERRGFPGDGDTGGAP